MKYREKYGINKCELKLKETENTTKMNVKKFRKIQMKA